MSDDPATPSGLPGTHLELYLRTDGAEGVYMDFTGGQGSPSGPCLILKTTGRRSGRPSLVPLIYGEDGGRYVVVASHAGAPRHPAWFLNLEAEPQVAFQVGPQKYRGLARVAEGTDRRRLFDLMTTLYPPYADYQAGTGRTIPVVLLEPQTPIARL